MKIIIIALLILMSCNQQKTNVVPLKESVRNEHVMVFPECDTVKAIITIFTDTSDFFKVEGKLGYVIRIRGTAVEYYNERMYKIKIPPGKQVVSAY